jgi:4-aminobutyrate aminotransferase / (S)-3-amino-2-methylpropionate transaminase / 5-aminovalerate transaminase
MSFQAPPDVRVPPPGPRSRELASRLAALESPSVVARRDAQERASGEDTDPIVYAEGDGVNVVDVDGNRYVDLAAGFGALLLGHRPDAVAQEIERQSRRLWLALGDVFPSEAKVALCERLVRLYPQADARVMLGATGADAVTAALKTAVLATGRAGVLAFHGAYHGLSHGPLAACGLRPSYREPFAQSLNPHVIFAPYPHDPSSLDEAMTAVEHALGNGQVGAVLVEPILGRGGCVVPPSPFLAALRAACDRTGALLVSDEIWTGLGRSGAWLASVAAGVLPDLICLGKGLGGGLPISACIGSARAMAPWGAHGGTTIHTATHFGSPIHCAAALATLAALARDDLPARALRVGERWMGRLRAVAAGPGGLREVRGRGLMIGIALEGGGARGVSLSRKLLRMGWIVLTGGSRGDVLTLTPPLGIDESLLDAFCRDLANAVADP